MLRPSRPGAAYLASRTRSLILPVSSTGFNDALPLRLRNPSKATIRIGKAYQPPRVDRRGRVSRQQLDELGERSMQEIADLLPDRLRGMYSSDPSVWEKAKGVGLSLADSRLG